MTRDGPRPPFRKGEANGDSPGSRVMTGVPGPVQNRSIDIALAGHAVTQNSHPLQRSGSKITFEVSGSMCRASVGQKAMQAPQ